MQPGNPPDSVKRDSAEGRDARSRRRLISADRVQGTPVFDHEGDKIGHLEDVMLDKESGKVAYAIMSHGGILGAGEKYHPIPWTILRYDVDKQGYVVPLDKAQLEKAPTLDQTEIYGDDAWQQVVHSHYGTPAPFI
jgi:sporulation protein YlmC with PRC-barrel domain